VALACAFCAAAPAAAPGQSFTAPIDHPVGDTPDWLVVADLNGDDDADIVAVNEFSNSVSVLLGGAASSFAPAASYGVGVQPKSAAAADFDGDGDPDLAVSNAEAPTGPDTVSILLNAGNGTFTAGTDVSISGGPRRVIAGLFDNDADPDLAVTNGNGDSVSIRLGAAGATFGTQNNFAAADSPFGLAAGNFDGDADLDLAVANSGPDNVSILLGNGDGTFGSPTQHSVGDSPHFVAVGDFNGDADPDLAVANSGSHDVSVLLGGTGGTFAPPTTFAVGQAPTGVAAGDVTGDGDLDLVVANSAMPGFVPQLSLLVGGAGGSFAAERRLTTGGTARAVAIADVNADGAPDVISANGGNDNVSVLLNRASAPAAPTFAGTDPASPANDNSPRVRGAAPAGTTVRLYTSADCSGTPAATGSAGDFAGAGLAVAVPDDSTTTFRGIATNGADVPSDCSPASVTYVEHSSPPRAAITVAPPAVLTGAPVAFDASASTGFGISQYQWDLDGDGSFELDTGVTPSATRSYATPVEIVVTVRVSNDIGSSDATAPLSVRPTPPPGPLGISINRGAQFTNDANVSLAAVWPVLASTMLVANDGGFGVAGRFPLAAERPWTLDSSGPERLPKTVYVRFDDSSQTFTDDIILDETAPTIASATTAPTRPTTAVAAATRRRTYRVRVDARDTTSGVEGLQITSNRRRPGRLREFPRRARVRRTIRFTTRSRRIYVRARDAAGNDSRWRLVRRRHR
jgi:hypothetical protein